MFCYLISITHLKTVIDVVGQNCHIAKSNLYYIHAKASSYVEFFNLFHLQLAACVVYIYMLGLTFYPIACSASADTYLSEWHNHLSVSKTCKRTWNDLWCVG